MPRRATAILVLALLPPAAGCGGGGGEAEADPLVVIAGPEAFSSFELADERQRVVWRLVADRPTPVGELVYGRVPAGFRQEAPAGGGPPRPLALGEPLRLRSVTPRRVFEHRGWVASGERLTIERWTMTLREPPAVVPPEESTVAPAPERPDGEPARP